MGGMTDDQTDLVFFMDNLDLNEGNANVSTKLFLWLYEYI